MKNNQNTTRFSVFIVIVALSIMLFSIVSYKIWDNSVRYDKCLDTAETDAECDSCWLATHNY